MKEYNVVIALGDIHTSVLATSQQEAEDIAYESYKQGHYDMADINFVEAEEATGITIVDNAPNKSNVVAPEQNKVMCMHCSDPTEVEHIIHNGTHIYSCTACPDVTFEFCTQKDLDNLRDYLLTKLK